MSVRKHGNGWQVRVAGWPAVTVPMKRDALRLETDYKTQKALGHLWQAKPTTLGTELDLLLEGKRTMGGKRGALRPAGIQHYEKSISPWDDLRHILIPSLRRRTVEVHIMGRAAKHPVAARNELQVLKQALHAAESRGQLVDKAIFDIDPVRHQAQEGRALTIEELTRLSDAMPERIRRLPLLVGLVGFRFTEAVSLTDQMVDLDAALVQIPTGLNKSRRPKPVWLSRYEVGLLREQETVRTVNDNGLLFPTTAGQVYSKSGFRSIWVPALRKAGLIGFRFHWLRHTAVSLMAEAGMRPEWIALRVGHSDGGALILQRYRHLFPSEAAQAASLMDALIDAARAKASGHQKDKANV